MNMLPIIMHFVRDTRGATAIEYALIAVIIAVGLIFTVFTFGGELFEIFNRIGNTIAAG